MLRADRHLQAAEVNPLPGRVRLRGIPRPALGARHPRGLLVLGRLVVVELAVRLLVTVLRPVGFGVPVAANVC